VQTALAEVERDPELGPLEITITPRGRVDLPGAERFAALGVDRLNLPVRSSADEEELLTFIDTVGAEIVARL
jgi:hypothetical protein